MESKHCSSRAFSFARQNERAGFRGALSWNALLGLFGSLLLLSAAIDARSQVILGDGAVVCGLPVIFESICEKKGGGGGVGQRNWFKGGRRNWKERHLRLTSRWLQYLDAPLPDGVVKGSKEVSHEWTVNFNPKHANAITIECAIANRLSSCFLTRCGFQVRW